MNLIHKIFVSETFQKLANTKRISRFVGRLSDKHLPQFALKRIIRWFVKQYKIDLSEYDFDFDHLTNFNAFFTRRFLPNQRSFDGKISSPAEGFLLEYGSLQKEGQVNIKGKKFDFALPNCLVPIHQGSFATIYLSPADYHRFHAPFDLRMTSIAYVPGILKSVNEKSVANDENLYCNNEHITIFGSSEFGQFYYVIIGAIAVGRIILSLAPDLFQYDQPKEVEVNISVKRGEEIGFFELGSTVILAMESPILTQIDRAPNSRILLGEALVS
ncbi:MAG TPA: phosphatidylserine decarboxylase [Saprospiraceae bacterium]|nr:phosphatidylserine decarboxylase [Saprospiraceae bacterium]